MKHTVTLLLFAALGTTASALGQTTDSQAPAEQQIAEARCAYVQNENVCTPHPNQDAYRDAEIAQAQSPGRPDQPPFPPRRGMGYPGYPSPYPHLWVGEGHPGHALIGVLVGGTLGAVAGANVHTNGQTGPNVVGGLVLGGLGALFGGMIGNSIGWVHGQRYRHQSWPDDDEDARSKPQEPDSTRLAASQKPRPSRSTNATGQPASMASAP